MHNQTRAQMWWWGLTLIGMWLLGGGFAWTQDLGTAQIELMPPHPTPSDRLVIRLFGEWRNSCVPMNPQLSITGSEVRIETANPGERCAQIIASWELFVSVGQLPIGAYQVLVVHTAGNGHPQPIGQAGFAVQPNDEDECPDSDLSGTVVIDGCNSGVPNTVFPSGCTISDMIVECAEDASNHGRFVSCVSHITNDLKKAGTITGQQKGAIQSCAAQANIP